VDSTPAIAPEAVVTPTRVRETQVAIPGDADPIEFQALYLKFCGGIFQIKAGPGVVLPVQKPMNGVHLHANVDRIRFQAVGLRRSDDSIPLRPWFVTIPDTAGNL
jgi:hypothetical protein